jgi:4-hydroxybenzoate polyprenyltransferase
MRTEADPLIALLCAAAIVCAIFIGWYKRIHDRRGDRER